MKSPETEDTHRLDILAPPILLLGPLFPFLRYHGYPLLRAEIFIIIVGTILVGLAFGWILSRASPRLRWVLLNVLVLVVVDLLIDLDGYAPYLLVLTASGVLVWLLRRYVTSIMVVIGLAFLLGGAIATLVLWVQSRGQSPEPIEDVGERMVKSFDELIRSPLAAIAVVRASAVAIGTVVGIVWFPEHPAWPALTVLLVMTSKPGEAIGAGLLRSFGTLLGVLAAELVVGIAGGTEAILLLFFLLAAFGMFAFKNVAYWVYVLFLTAVLVLIQALTGADAGAAAADRLVATALGATIAFIGIGIGRLVISPEERRQRAG